MLPFAIIDVFTPCFDKSLTTTQKVEQVAKKTVNLGVSAGCAYAGVCVGANI